MRLLIYTPHYLPATRYGGPVRSVHELARGLVALGHEVHMLTTDMDGPQRLDVDLTGPTDLDGVQVHYCPIDTPRRLYRSPAMAARARALMPGMDGVHLNGVFLWPGPAIGRIARKAGVPVVLAPRGMLMPGLIAGKSRAIKLAWLVLFERANLAGAAALHVTAEAEAEGLREMGLDLAPIQVVPNGVTSPPPPAPADIDAIWGDVPAGLRVAYLGRLGWNKGIDLAIEAVRSHPGAMIRLAGYDEIGLRAKLEPRLIRPDGSTCGTFLGQLDGVEKWALLAGADVLLVPSLQENFGNVVTEAMAIGTPVIATTGVGAATYLAQIDPELRVPRTQEVLTTRLAALLADAPRRARIAEAGQELIKAKLAWPSIARSLAELFDRLAQGGGPQ
jgi:glycosyltransferase involved in cell wall biosynthesis